MPKTRSILAAILVFSMLSAPAAGEPEKKDFIKWVDFTPTIEVLNKTLALDISSQKDNVKLDWIDLLAFLAAKYGGDFEKFSQKDLDKLVKSLRDGKSVEELAEKMKYFPYYREAYGAVLGEFVGEYRVEAEEGGVRVWKEKYGLKVFSPIAKNFPFGHYDDFGAGRSYGFKRRHLGHDLLAEVGTPVIAVETSVVEAIGWNQYGGWRLGLRSLDGKRYYYYAHLRKNRPYAAGLEEGRVVAAGDVIGYVGRSGYSRDENTNNIKQSHLHFGMQLIFDESQRQGPTEIWIDVYAITMLLQKNRSEVVRDAATKEYSRKYGFSEGLLELE